MTPRGSEAVLPATTAPHFALLGVTWDRGADDAAVTVEVRVRSTKGWSDWEHLEVDEEPGEGGRAGTEPWWVDSADQVAARVTASSGPAPTGVKVVTVDPGESAPVSSTGSTSSAFYSKQSSSHVVSISDGTPTYTPRPKIIGRATWKAKGQKKSNSCDDAKHGYPKYGLTMKGVVLHHTAGSNSYSKKQSASIVRGIQSYHMKGRGWCDIAYNFLVDKYGQIFKGRAGDTNRTIRGSHAGITEVNTDTMGVSLMGNLDKKKPTTAMKNATVKLIGWRMGTTYLAATGKYTEKYKVKKHYKCTVHHKKKTCTKTVTHTKSLNRIAGHRNVVSTACPGKYGYAWLVDKSSHGLRTRVKKYISDYTSGIKTAAAKLPTSVKGVVKTGEVGSSTRRHTVFSKLDFYWLKGAGAYSVSGAVRTAYKTAGGSNGKLGYPLGDLSVPDVDGNSVQQFEHGTITLLASGKTTVTMGEPTTPTPTTPTSPAPAAPAPVAPTSPDPTSPTEPAPSASDSAPVWWPAAAPQVWGSGVLPA